MEHLAERGLTCPLPVETAPGRRSAASPAGRRQSSPFSTACRCGGRSRSIARALGAALAQLHRAGADFPLERPNALSVGGLAAAFSRAAAGPTGRAGLAERRRARSSPSRPRLAARPAERRHSRRSFPDNVSSSSERLSGLIDFYFACTDARLRSGDLPQRLVLRSRRLVQRHQGARAARRLRRRPAALGGRDRGLAACLPAAPRCAFC